MSKKYEILIADDHAMLREGIKSLLTRESDITVTGEAGNGKEAVIAANKLNPDLILMDLSMPLTNGADAVKNIKHRNRDTKVLVLTLHKSEEHIYESFKAGADGYLLKENTHAELLNAIHQVLKGNIYLSPSICETVVTSFLNPIDKSHLQPRWKSLSAREREVLKLIAEGLRNKQIADYLSLSHKTVEKHRSNIMRKLNLHSTAELTGYAIENGLISK